MGRVIGTGNRTEFALDPAEAWRRGRELDRMLQGAFPLRARGVRRGTHAEFNRQDDLRALEIARRINTPETAVPG